MDTNKYKKLLEFTPIYETLPEGWRILEGATNKPRGYAWICNGESIFSKNRRTALLKLNEHGNN